MRFHLKILKIVFISSAIVLSACNLVSGRPTPIPTPDLPRVEFVFPQNGSTIVENTDLSIDIAGSDDSFGVARIELLVDDLFHQEGRPVEGNAVPIFTVRLNWLAQGIGQHSLTAIAYRPDGTASTPSTVNIQVLQRAG